MCGIAGMIGKAVPASSKNVQQMLNLVRHRGPDGEGIFCNGKIALGHRRLAILDLSPDGNQPMQYDDSRYLITYNGEVYNYLELRKELENKGHCFITQTDTEVILAAYAEWGEQCVERFNGMWAFAIYDSMENTVFCSRDRFGVKPFYYWDGPDAFYFGSEIKELWLHMVKPVKANLGVLLAFLTTGERDYSEQTFFDQVFQLRGGHNILYDLKANTYVVKKWYDVDETKGKLKYSYEDAVMCFRKTFQAAVKVRLRSDVPVGCTLSGGLDSSAITCTVDKIKGTSDSLHTISSCFKEKAFDEQEYIDEVLRATKTIGHKVWPAKELNLKELDEAIWIEDEPGVASAGRTVYQTAHELDLPVMLVGEGADEQLAGYTNFFETLFLYLFGTGQWGCLVKQLKAYKNVREPLDHVTLKHILQVAVCRFFLPIKMMDYLRVHRKGYAANRFYARRVLDHKETYRARNLYAGISSKKITKAYMFSEMSNILHGLDRSSMAFSIETRAPFLDKNLVEQLYHMPLNYKLWNGVTKRVMRDALKEDMPEKITYRYGKMGFMTPEFQWFYQEPEKVTQLLLDACNILKDYINTEAVLQWCEEQKGKDAKATNEAWLMANLLQVGRWMKIYQVTI